MTIEYLDWADCLAFAEDVTGRGVETLLTVTNVGLADSSQAGLGDEGLYALRRKGSDPARET